MTSLSNTEAVIQLMESGTIGPLAQVIVMRAIRKYTDDIISDGRPEKEEEAAVFFISYDDYYTAVEQFSKELAELRPDNVPTTTLEENNIL